MNRENIAKIAHETLRAHREVTGARQLLAVWPESTEEHRQRVVAMVDDLIHNPDVNISTTTLFEDPAEVPLFTAVVAALHKPPESHAGQQSAA